MSTTTTQAPYCTHGKGKSHCYRRTKHESGLCALHRPDRVAPPRVGGPIIFRAVKDGPEFEVRPCSGKHRDLWLGGYIILSCTKCNQHTKRLDEGSQP